MRDTHKIVGMHTRIPPWSHDAHRSGALLWPPQPPKLDLAAMVPEALRQREEAIAAEAKEATKIASRLEEANRLREGSAPQGVGWLMGMNEIAALRAAAQALTDAVEDDERRSGGLLSRLTLKRSAELRRLLLCIYRHGIAGAPRSGSDFDGAILAGSRQRQRQRGRDERDEQHRL